MATGSTGDILARLRRYLPPWFADSSPIRDALLSGFATALAWVYGLYAYARAQTRIATASDGFLDLIAQDFFGPHLRRKPGQSDSAFRAIIMANLIRQRGTRQAMYAMLLAITGRAPHIFEPMRPADTGSYCGPASGYGVAGGYGSLMMPAQAMVIAYRPTGSGVPGVAGYGSPIGGYGAGAAEYATPAMTVGVTDADIYAAIEAVRPAGVTIWAQISN